MTKTCKKCQDPRPIASFPVKRRWRTKNGEAKLKRGATCRRCLKSAASVAKRCVECSQPVVPGQLRCELHRQRRARYINEKNARNRKTVFDHYGPCRYCGQTLEFFLTIDHINDDGAEHRKTVPGSHLYRWLIANGFPPEFQTLCYNCNGAKAKLGADALLKALADHGIINANHPKTTQFDAVGCDPATV